MVRDEISDVVFEMAKHMAKARAENPKYVVKEIPKVGIPLEVFEYIPKGGTISEGEYESTGKIIPREITREKEGSNWYLIEADAAQLVVYINQLN